MLALLGSFVVLVAAIVIALIPIALVFMAMGIFGAIRFYRRWMFAAEI